MMAGEYAVPAEIRAMRPQGTTVKKLKGGYYVYETKSTSVRVVGEDGRARWKTKTKSGPIVGKIVPGEGFVPNGGRTYEGEVTDFQYGAFQLVVDRSGGTLERLKAAFDKRDAIRIYCLACLFVVLRMQRIRDISRRFQASVLALLWPFARLGKSAVSKLYEDMGERTGQQTAFQQSLVDSSSGKVAVDGHVIARASERNPLSAWGHEHKKPETPQPSLIEAYDVAERRPLCGDMVCGSTPDCISLEVLLGRFRFRDTLFLADRGLDTATDKALMSADGNSYIVPMVADRNDYKSVYDRFKVDRRRFFLYDKEGGATIVYYRAFDEDGVRRVCYVDTAMAGAERATYARHMAEGKAGYTAEGLVAAEKDFGLFILECSDTTKTPQQIYCDYKERWGLETFYDYVKHDLDFEALHLQGAAGTRGLAFVVHVAGLVHAEVVSSLSGTGVSLSDAVEILSDVMLTRVRDGFRMQNETKEVRELCGRIGLDLSAGVKRVVEVERAWASAGGKGVA